MYLFNCYFWTSVAIFLSSVFRRKENHIYFCIFSCYFFIFFSTCNVWCLRTKIKIGSSCVSWYSGMFPSFLIKLSRGPGMIKKQSMYFLNSWPILPTLIQKPLPKSSRISQFSYRLLRSYCNILAKNFRPKADPGPGRSLLEFFGGLFFVNFDRITRIYFYFSHHTVFTICSLFSSVIKT